MMKVAEILKGKTIAPTVSLCIAPGSKQVLNMLALNGALSDMINAGARILESACGPCIGMGQSPNSKGVSLRTFNRNFEGRSGTADGKVYLVSPETAVAAALTGEITDPMSFGEMPKVEMPGAFKIDDSAVIAPAPLEEAKELPILRGPNIWYSKWATILQQTTSCRQAQRFCHTVPTFRTCPSTASAYVMRHSRKEQKRRERA